MGGRGVKWEYLTIMMLNTKFCKRPLLPILGFDWIRKCFAYQLEAGGFKLRGRFSDINNSVIWIKELGFKCAGYGFCGIVQDWRSDHDLFVSEGGAHLQFIYFYGIFCGENGKQDGYANHNRKNPKSAKMHAVLL
jgi:hypothetical protein